MKPLLKVQCSCGWYLTTSSEQDAVRFSDNHLRFKKRELHRHIVQIFSLNGGQS